MKKYTEWQKYVKEQTEKAGRQRQGEDPEMPPKQIPAIDRERFVIRKKETEQPGQKIPAAPPARPFTPADAAPADDAPASPMASPFVSVHDVWKAAEKSTVRGRASEPDTAPQHTPRNRIKTSRLPEIKRTEPKQIDTADLRTPTREETREQILERLINPTISLEEAAKIMGVCKATVRRYTAMGILPHYRTPGNQRRFKLNDIIQFLESQKH